MKGQVMAKGAVALVMGLAASAAVYAAAQRPAVPQPAPAPEASPMVPAGIKMPPRAPGNFMTQQGYLPQGAMPDSLLLNPPPPAPGSATEARDQEASKAGLLLRGTPRWDLAIRDADVFSAAATSTFSCAAGLPIGPSTTPKINTLMLRAARDLAMATRATKMKYQRPRPFMVNNQPTCTPDMEEALRHDGSYPSGHSAIGYGWGLILSEVVPDRTTQLVARGRAFGDSRRVCNVHWLNDVEEGRVDATAVFARMNAEPGFRADVEAARAEAAALKTSSPAVDCAKEAAALAGG